MNLETSGCQYEVCLSFAGEDRGYVEAVATNLEERDIPVFYDRYEEVQLWGRDLVERLATVYMQSARFCVMFVSAHYRNKVWPSHECASALARALRDKEYLLPVRFDDTEIPGLLPTIAYVDARVKTPDQLADMIAEKLAHSIRDTYYPSNPVALLTALGAETEDAAAPELYAAFVFFEALKLMDPEERKVLFLFFQYACPADLPENVHISQNLLSRVAKMSVSDLRQLLGAISSLGFATRQRRGHGEMDHLGEERMFELEWHDRSIDGVGNATHVVSTLIGLVMEGRCQSCAMDALMRLDFGALGQLRREMVQDERIVGPDAYGDAM